MPIVQVRFDSGTSTGLRSNEREKHYLNLESGSRPRKGYDMFGKKGKPGKPVVEFDPANQIAVLKCSICNGEQVAGFKDKKTGHFTEVAFIRSPQELNDFLQTYGITDIVKEY